MNTNERINFAARTTRFTPAPGHRVIAQFGPARLVRNPDGRHELIGGTADECAQAREWCSLFAPDIVFTPAPPAPGTLALSA